MRTSQSVAEALDSYVQFSTGAKGANPVPDLVRRVRPDPLVDGLGLDTNRERPVVDEFMSVPAAPDIYACRGLRGRADLTRPGQVCGMTAQHAQRQGKRVARNMAASPGIGKAQPYAVTRGYHLFAKSGNHLRVLADWAQNAVTPAEATLFGVISAESVPLDVGKPCA